MLILLGRDVTMVSQRRALLRGRLGYLHGRLKGAFFQPREARASLFVGGDTIVHLADRNSRTLLPGIGASSCRTPLPN
jgi:hypothetical protein